MEEEKTEEKDGNKNLEDGYSNWLTRVTKAATKYLNLSFTEYLLSTYYVPGPILGCSNGAAKR